MADQFLTADSTNFNVANISEYTSSTPARYDVFNDVHQQFLNNDAYLNANANAMKATKTVTVNTSWSGATAPVTKVVNVSGVTSTDTPIIGFVPDGTNAASIKAQKKAFSCVDKIESGNGTLTFYCYNKVPQTTFKVSVKGK